MKIIPLPFETQVRLGKSVKIVLDYTDFTATGVNTANNTTFTAAWTSGTGQQIDPPNLQSGQVGTFLPIVTGNTTLQSPAGVEIKDTVINVTSAFTSSGGTITTLTLGLGDAGSATRFLQAVSLLATGYTETTASPYIESAAWGLVATLTISGQTVASLTGGTLEIYAVMRPISDLTLVK